MNPAHTFSRRRFLQRNALGVGSVALAWMLREEGLLATPANVPRQPQSFDLKPKIAPRRGTARAMISLFMHGGPSHVDLFDPKPDLKKLAGKPLPDSFGMVMTRRKVAANPLLPPLLPLRPRGESASLPVST